MKKQTEKVVYNVGALSTTEWKVAKEATKNIAKNIANDFKNEVLSISQFCNWLTNKNDDSCMFVKNYVLGLINVENVTKEIVFNAFREKFPFKNENGKLVAKKPLCKGVQTCEEIALFDESVLDTLVLSYLRKDKVITLPKYFTTDKKGNVSEIEEEEALSKIEEANNAKKAKKAKKENEEARNARLLSEFLAMQDTFKNCKKLDDYKNAVANYFEIVNS